MYSEFNLKLAGPKKGPFSPDWESTSEPASPLPQEDEGDHHNTSSTSNSSSRKTGKKSPKPSTSTDSPTSGTGSKTRQQQQSYASDYQKPAAVSKRSRRGNNTTGTTKSD